VPTASPAAMKAAQGDDETGLKGNNQPPLPLVENTKVIARVKQDEQQAIVDTYTEAAVKFITDNRDKAFFLYLPHTAVHFPDYPGKKWAGKSPNGIYSDWVEEVDWSVGQVLDTVRKLKLESKTMVLFTSDNGGTSRAVNAPLRGNKGSTWEGGMREPTVAWWPGKIPAGTSTDEITGMMDMLPTLAAIAGAKAPTDRKLDGMNIWPVLAGEPGATGHDVFYYFKGLKLEAVRSGPWKMHLPGVNVAAGKNAPKKKDKKAPAPTGPQLYNLQSDIGESKNVAAANPEVISRLEQLAAAMASDLGTDGVGPGVRPLGRSANPQPFILNDGTVRPNAVGKKKRFD